MAIIPPEPEYLNARKALLKEIRHIIGQYFDDYHEGLLRELENAVYKHFPDGPSAEGLVFDFLRKQKLNPFYIPPIEELGRLEGGYALVKAISARGGLKKFRKSYAEYIYKTHPEWFQ